MDYYYDIANNGVTVFGNTVNKEELIALSAKFTALMKKHGAEYNNYSFTVRASIFDYKIALWLFYLAIIGSIYMSADLPAKSLSIEIINWKFLLYLVAICILFSSFIDEFLQKLCNSLCYRKDIR